MGLPSNPRHVAIIMDGNGRWATRRMMPRVVGHREGVKSFHRCIEAALACGIGYLTVFAFSSENWRRPKQEVSFLIHLFEDFLEKEMLWLKEQKICLKIIGSMENIAPNLVEKARLAERETATGQALVLTIAANYGGRWDIIEGVKRLMASMVSPDQISEEMFSSFLATFPLPDPDLLIRTGGEQRISNFMIWQLAYTELYFCDTLWPDFCEKDFLQALEWYRLRERRFGGLSKDECSRFSDQTLP
jgi:undecaprenyl diphosphate synthase